MKIKTLSLVVASALVTNMAHATDVNLDIETPKHDTSSTDLVTSEKEAGTSLYVSPHVSANPTSEIGGGATLGYVYKMPQQEPVDGSEAPEAPFYNLALSATYFSSKSFSVGALNHISLDGGNQKIETSVSYDRYYNKYDSDSEYGDKTVSTIGTIYHKHSVRMLDDWFIGAHVKFTDSNYHHENRGGKEFLGDMGYTDTQSLGLGLSLSLDTRDNAIYTTSGNRVAINTFSHFDKLWNTHNYHIIEMNFADYRQVNGNDVIATNFYGRYTTDKTPTSMQSQLGDINVLRGFKQGQIVGDGLSAVQAEYRYFLTDRWKIVGFAGVANVVGGASETYGTDGTYYSGGAGVRYKILENHDTHLRVDYAIGSDENHGLYIGFQEAF